jgi:hypothetical protein
MARAFVRSSYKFPLDGQGILEQSPHSVDANTGTTWAGCRMTHLKIMILYAFHLKRDSQKQKACEIVIREKR